MQAHLCCQLALAIVSKLLYIVTVTHRHDLGSFIRQQRERSAMSLRKLADKAGISNPYLSQIERGLRKPSAEILKSLARALSIRAESLYERAGLLEGVERPGVAEAIESDPQLTITQKQALLEIYKSFSDETTQE
jgi:transcriptional regulator with XRE-family HTH domain